LCWLRFVSFGVNGEFIPSSNYSIVFRYFSLIKHHAKKTTKILEKNIPHFDKLIGCQIQFLSYCTLFLPSACLLCSSTAPTFFQCWARAPAFLFDRDQTPKFWTCPIRPQLLARFLGVFVRCIPLFPEATRPCVHRFQFIFVRQPGRRPFMRFFLIVVRERGVVPLSSSRL